MKDELLYIVHILECIDKIERYTSAGQETLTDDTMVYDAVLRNLQTLSEATQKLSDETKALYENIP